MRRRSVALRDVTACHPSPLGRRCSGLVAYYLLMRGRLRRWMEEAEEMDGGGVLLVDGRWRRQCNATNNVCKAETDKQLIGRGSTSDRGGRRRMGRRSDILSPPPQQAPLLSAEDAGVDDDDSLVPTLTTNDSQSTTQEL